jgi:hypothetical protein
MKGERIMRIRLAWMLVLFSFFGCGNRPEVVEGPLTQKVLERHLVDLGPVRYTADDGWNWTCERVYVIIRQSSTDAEVRVYEKGNKRTGTVRGIPRYAAGSRNATYHLERNSGNDDWYINTSEGEPVRKFGNFKIRLALRTGEFIKTEELGKVSKALSTDPTSTPQAEEPLPGSPQTEGKPDSQPSIDELQKALVSLEDSLRYEEACTFPDAVVVKGGKEIKCEIVSETVNSIRIRTDVGTNDVSRDRIVSVTHATQQEKEEALRAKSEIEELQKQRFELKACIRELKLTAQYSAAQEERTEAEPDYEPRPISKEDELVAPGEESATTPISIRPDAPVQEVAPKTFALTGHNLIRNGDFSDGLSQWEKTHSSKVEDMWEVAVKGEEKYLAWSRERSGNDGGTVGAIQQMEADVGRFEKLIISADVRVSNHTLSGPGWWAEQRGGSGEYPAKILVYYKDAKGKPHVWTHGFLPELRGRTSLANFSNVPWDTWYHYEADLMNVAELVDMDFKRRGQRLPLPAQITAIKLLGQGWDFAAAVDNIELLGKM